MGDKFFKSIDLSSANTDIACTAETISFVGGSTVVRRLTHIFHIIK